jgi:glycosyltransferase involved in cell wall biosynthesis
MAPEKQTEVAVRAVSEFASRTGADAELVVAGDGPSANEIKALTERCGVRARFLGAISQTSLQKWMAASDVLLFPSATETFGNVVLEAMACGLPVVGAAGGAVPDTVRDGENGLLCRPGDGAAFADKLGLLYQDASLRARLSVAGEQEARERSWDEVFRALKTSIDEAVGNLSATL